MKSKKSLATLALVSASLALSNKPAPIAIIEYRRGDEWRGGSRGKGGKTKWPRR